jgi:DNA polymerase-3 subunit chi
LTRIDFYQIDGHLWQTPAVVSRLIGKARQRRMDILIHVPDQNTAEKYHPLLQKALDDPSPLTMAHTAPGPGEKTQTVTLCWNGPYHHHGLMINLANDPPRWFSRFEKIAELVYADTEVVACKRDSFRFYRDRGYPLHYHDLSASTREST